MTNEEKHALWAKIKTAFLALVVTALLVLAIHGNKKNSSTNHDAETGALKQRIAKLKKSLQDNRETLRETHEANRTLREMLSELRGIHNDCQRNATENFLHPPRRR